MPTPHHDVEFTKQGSIHEPAQVTALLNAVPGVTDLLVLCHGWNNDMREARDLYTTLLANIDELLAIRGEALAPESVRKLQGRTFAALWVFWPSKKFADTDLIPGGGAASATAANDAATVRVLDELKRDPERLGAPSTDQQRAKIVDQAKALLPHLEAKADARREYVKLLRLLLDQSGAHEDDGSANFFNADPETLFRDLGKQVVAPPPPSPEGATGIGNAAGAASLGDFLEGAQAAARRLANYATYYQMKSRAGTVGATGIADVVRQCRDKNAAVRVHLVGHSFGGRAVTAAAHALAAGTPNITVTLLQAAFSHNGLSGDFDGKGAAGFFRRILSEKRVSGPIVITHTKNDRAVGIAYPLASRIAFEKAAAVGDENDPYGGMGRNGAQKTNEAAGHSTALGAIGVTYEFAPGTVNNLKADEFVKDHGDVAGIQVAYAILNAAGAI
jgi:pimeloyl-ACP methyl ester carboxylesterase